MIQQITGELEPAELLPVGTLLHRRYAIDGVLARGTYGIAYVGHDDKTSTRIVIKEYFPYALADRAGENNALMPKNKACGGLFYLGSEMFYRQHLALTDAKGSSNLVTVYTAFFENGTSYAVMNQLEGVTLDRYLRLRGRRLTTGECMFILASMADALLVVHSLNSLHYDITAHSIFLCTDGTVKLIAFGAAKAGLRARREVDDTEPWVDLSALAKTLYEAMTGQAVFHDAIQPNPNIPQPLFHLFWRMIDQSGAQGIASVFDYRHALACIDLPAECPLVNEAGVASADTGCAEKCSAGKTNDRGTASGTGTETEPICTRVGCHGGCGDRREAGATGIRPGTYARGYKPRKENRADLRRRNRRRVDSGAAVARLDPLKQSDRKNALQVSLRGVCCYNFR